MSSSVHLSFPRKDRGVLLRARADCSDLPVGGTKPESDGDAGGHGALRGLLGGSYSLKISHQEMPLPVGRFSPYQPGLGDHFLVLGSVWLSSPVCSALSKDRFSKENGGEVEFATSGLVD